MLNLITITSIETTFQQNENDPCKNIQKTPTINSNSSYISDDQKRGNIQSLSKTTKPDKNSNYFLIKSHDKVYLHPFQGVCECMYSDQTQHFINQSDNGFREFLYHIVRNEIHNKSIIKTSYQKFQSPIIEMLVDNKVMIQILINNSKIDKFDLKRIDRAGSISFFTLIKHKPEVYGIFCNLFFSNITRKFIVQYYK